MVDTHGSQCGFCTPGFVMSLFTLYQQGKAPTRAGDRRRTRRQSLPLHRLPPDRRCGACTPARASAADRWAQARPTPRASCERSMTARTSSSARPTASSPGPPRRRRWRGLRPNIPTPRSSSGATDVGLWVTKQLRDAAEDHPHRRREAAACRSSDDGASVSHRRRGDLCRGRRRRSPPSIPISASCCAASAPRRCAPRAPSAATSPTARRSATCRRMLIALGATLTLRHGDSERALPLEDFFIAYGKQDRAARRIRLAHRRAEARRRTRRSAPTRSPSASTRTSRPSWRPSSSRWTAAASPRPASPSAAWRQRRSARAASRSGACRRIARRASELGAGDRRTGAGFPADRRHARLRRLSHGGGAGPAAQGADGGGGRAGAHARRRASAGGGVMARGPPHASRRKTVGKTLAA